MQEYFQVRIEPVSMPTTPIWKIFPAWLNGKNNFRLASPGGYSLQHAAQSTEAPSESVSRRAVITSLCVTLSARRQIF